MSKIHSYRPRLVLVLALMLSFLGCSKSSPGDGGEPDASRITYAETSTLFPNPERGFMRTLIVFSEGAPLDAAQLGLLRGQNITLILRLFYFDAFKDKALSTTELNLIQADLDKVRNAGLKAILRFAYTDEMSGTDAPLAIVNQHLDQLKPLLETNKDVVAFVQAGFIGAYGEWHSSSNGLATTENQRTVLTKILSTLPAELMVQVRTPGQKQAIFGTTSPVTAAMAYGTEGIARVGHHNDCFLTGGSDYGTYDNVVTQKQYISNEANFVPTGGETCPPSAGYDPSCVEGRNEMKLLKWTYLNLDYYQPTLSAWRSSGCFDEFQRALGYRLALVDGLFPATASLNGSLAVDLTMVNRGYAPLYHRKATAIILKNMSSGAFTELPMALDVRTIKPGGTVSVKETVSLSGVPAGNYTLFLRIADMAPSLKSRVEYAVRLANDQAWTTDNGGMNDLKQQLTIQ